MEFNDIETQLLFKPAGTCRLNASIHYISYNKKNWKDVKAFCKPFSLERTQKGQSKGRAVIDLPTGNESFEYGSILVKLGNKRILILNKTDFEDLFYIC